MKHNILLLNNILILFLLFGASFTNANNCKRAFLILANSPKTGSTEPLTDNQADEIYDAAHTAYTTINPGNTRPKSGRTLSVPRAARDLITERLKGVMGADFNTAKNAELGKADFITLGNVGHIEMYNRLMKLDSAKNDKFPNGAVKDIFGLDIKDLEAIVIAHDNDKQLPKPGDPLAARALQKLGGPLAAVEYALGLHGHKSLQRVAQIIRELGKEQDWSDEDQYKYFAAYADQIGGHNFGIDLADLDPVSLREKFPSLNDAEATALATSFYDRLVNQGGQFGPVSINQRMGFAPSDRDGGLRSPLARQLIQWDRGTIVDWRKVGGDNLSRMNFDPAAMETTFRFTANGALAQVKALTDMRRNDVLPNRGYYVDASGIPVKIGTPGSRFQKYTVADLPSNDYFLSEGQKWIKAADKLKSDNGLGLRREAGISDKVDPISGNVIYDKAILYRPIESDGSQKIEYVVRGDYTQVEGKGPKTYQLSATRRDLLTGISSEVPIPKNTRNPLEILGELMIQYGDLSKPL